MTKPMARSLFGLTPTILLATFVGLGTVGRQHVCADEPVAEFLDALRDQRMFEMAIEYLDRLEKRQDLPPTVKVTLPYDRAKTQIMRAGFERKFESAKTYLDEAQTLLKKFIAENPSHPSINGAQLQLGNLLQQRAINAINKSKTPGGASQKGTLVAEGRRLYDEALKVFTDSIARLMKLVDADNKRGFIDREKEPVAYAARLELRKDYLQSQLLAAAILEEKADTYEAQSKESVDLLKQAIERYNDIYTKYRSRTAGLYARLYQGRANQKIKNYKDALSLFEELLAQPDDEGFREVKTEALDLAIQCWIADEQKKYAVAVSRGTAWVDRMRPNEATQAIWLSLRLNLAKAHIKYAEDLRKKNPKDRQANRSVEEARKLVQRLTEINSPYREEARQLLVSLPGHDPNQAKDEPDPTNFADAKIRAKRELDRLASFKTLIEVLPERIANAQSDEEKKDLQAQVAKAKDDLSKGQIEALRLYKLAIELATPEDPLEEINICRYSVCYLLYQQQKFYEAAVVGEYVATRHPESSAARECARISMACFVSIYSQNVGAGDLSFEKRKVIDSCLRIATRWKGEPEAVDAINRVIPFLISEQRVSEAEALLPQVPEESPGRANAELQVGKEYWRQYRLSVIDLRKSQESGTLSDEDKAQAEKKQNELREKAAKLLKAGVTRSRANPTINRVLTTATLSLVQYYVANGAAEQAVELLEDPKMGLLMLVGKKDPATQRKGFAQQVYTSALSSYIGMLPSAQAPQGLITKATNIMGLLKNIVGDDAAGQRQLVGIYYNLARDLETQMNRAKTDAEKKSLATGFETFVNAVGKGSEDFTVLQWVAETFAGLAKGFEKGRKMTAESQRYYEQAVDFYQKILDKAKADPNWIAEDVVLQVKWRLALSKRGLRDFKAAMDLFASILVKKNTKVDVQADAAMTYQMWARADKAGYYAKAIGGGYFSKKRRANIVWGWDRLAKAVARNREAFRDNYHQARLNHLICMTEYALRKEKASKEKYLKAAKTAMETMVRVNPEMGGPSWYKRYDSVYRRVQKELNVTVSGLPKATAKPLTSE